MSLIVIHCMRHREYLFSRLCGGASVLEVQQILTSHSDRRKRDGDNLLPEQFLMLQEKGSSQYRSRSGVRHSRARGPIEGYALQGEG